METKQQRADYYLKTSKLKNTYANLDMLEYEDSRNIDRLLIETLTTCNYIEEGANVIIIGASGTGKTFIAKALGVEACNNCIRTRVIHMRAILRELADCEDKKKSFERKLSWYSNIPLLIIDEWLTTTPERSDIANLMELIERRYSLHSTIFCSQMPTENWPKAFGNLALGEAITGRIKARAYEIKLSGDDIRKRHNERP